MHTFWCYLACHGGPGLSITIINCGNLGPLLVEDKTKGMTPNMFPHYIQSWNNNRHKNCHAGRATAGRSLLGQLGQLEQPWGWRDIVCVQMLFFLHQKHMFPWEQTRICTPPRWGLWRTCTCVMFLAFGCCTRVFLVIQTARTTRSWTCSWKTWVQTIQTCTMFTFERKKWLMSSLNYVVSDIHPLALTTQRDWKPHLNLTFNRQLNSELPHILPATNNVKKWRCTESGYVILGFIMTSYSHF